MKKTCSIMVALIFIITSLVALNQTKQTQAAFTSNVVTKISVSAHEWIIDSLAVSTDSLSASLTWSSVYNYVNYEVQYSITENFESIETSTVNGLSITISGLSENTKYYFRARPVGSPTGTWSTVVSSTTSSS
jgi:hypothetical protein